MHSDHHNHIVVVTCGHGDDSLNYNCVLTIATHPDIVIIPKSGFIAIHNIAMTAAGNPVACLPSTGIGRRARAFSLRLQTGCRRTVHRLFRQSGRGSPSCAQCPADETVEHILCQCPGYADIRQRLFNTYAQLGLPHVSPEHLLFLSANVATLHRAFHALLDFLGNANIFTRL
ncbi:hypothetical protein MRX96_020650 [Rhipicephalus microplus]